MELYVSFAIVALAAATHASFQLSVSVLTLLSGHAIGAEKSYHKLIRLCSAFIFGAGTMTVLLLSMIALVCLSLLTAVNMTAEWTVAAGALIGLGIAVWLFYYRRERGTALWVPRGVADYLADRTKATRRSVEAFSLGLTSVIGELIFIALPLAVAALALIQLPPAWQLAGIGLYAIISLAPLLIVAGLIGSGHNISRIQKWRESNKYFLQFSAGAGLIILSGFIYVYEIMPSTTGVGL